MNDTSIFFLLNSVSNTNIYIYIYIYICNIYVYKNYIGIYKVSGLSPAASYVQR